MRLPRLLRLPVSPIENSLEGRAFVFSGFAVAVLAVVLYGQDYVIPAVGVVATAIGHVVSYRERAQKRGFRRHPRKYTPFAQLRRIRLSFCNGLRAESQEFFRKDRTNPR